MSKEKNIPALRFPEFDIDWSKTTLGNIASFSKGKGISKSDITEQGKIECIRYGELYTEYQEIIQEIKSKTNREKVDLVFSKYNDIIIPSSGETQLDIATASCVLKAGVALGGDLTIIRSKINGIFLSFYLNNRKKKDIASLAQGSSVVHLYSSQLESLQISYPKTEEQNKIATFLEVLYSKLNLLNTKKNKLEQYKKSIMQKIFNQEIRFKDEKGKNYPDWELKKLGEITLKKSSNISANKIEGNFGNYTIYGASGILKKVDFYEEENDYVSIVKDGAGAGRLFYCPGKSSVLGTMEIIKPQIHINTYFLYCILSTIDFVKYIAGSTIPHIYFKDYSQETFGLPSLAEQTKIANFLSAIDDKIKQVNTQLEKTKEYKKGLLQQMFV